jgi:hypothetical protein
LSEACHFGFGDSIGLRNDQSNRRQTDPQILSTRIQRKPNVVSETCQE